MYIWMDSVGLIALELTAEQVNAVAQPGDNEPAIKEILPNLRNQLDTFSDVRLQDSLRECGDWSDEELQDRHDNEMRLVWIACHDVSDYPELYPGNDV